MDSRKILEESSNLHLRSSPSAVSSPHRNMLPVRSLLCRYQRFPIDIERTDIEDDAVRSLHGIAGIIIRIVPGRCDDRRFTPLKQRCRHTYDCNTGQSASTPDKELASILYDRHLLL